MTCDPLRCEVRISASIVRCSSVNDSSQTSSSSSSSSSVSLSTLSSSHALRHPLILHLLLSPQPHLPLPSLQHPFLCPIPSSICRPSSIVGHGGRLGGALVESITFNWRVVGSTPAQRS